MKYWMSSDMHFGHANIIKYCNRPFRNVEHMNLEIVRRYNERVKPDDQVFILGDFCFKNSNADRGEGVPTPARQWISMLNGNKFFVKGNHDKNNSMKTLVDACVITYAGVQYWCVHDPRNYNPKYPINFVGHVHEKWRYRIVPATYTILINVGVDVWDFYPQTIEHLLSALKFHHKNNVIEEFIAYERPA